MPTSASPSIRQSFDYAKLDAPTSQFVQQQTREIRILMRRTAEDIVEIGQRLISIKEKLEHGYFLEWLETEFDGHRDTANKFMQVAREFGSLEMSKISTFEISALYKLAAPSTPQAARNEAIARASAGEPITFSTAKAIRQKYVPARRRKTAVEKTPILPTTKLQPESQNQAIASLRPKAEILAIRPKEAVQELALTQETETAPPTIPSTKSTRIQTGSWWQIAQQHLLYCGSPDSSRFQERLPNQVSLQLTFPPSRSNWQESVSPKIKSALCLWSSYPDQNLRLLRELVERALLLYTESSETIAFSFLPDPELLILAHQLECRCLVAEPDLQRCQEAIALWQTKGYKVERVKTLRF